MSLVTSAEFKCKDKTLQQLDYLLRVCSTEVAVNELFDVGSGLRKKRGIIGTFGPLKPYSEISRHELHSLPQHDSNITYCLKSRPEGEMRTSTNSNRSIKRYFFV
jgi:hypothetical protein